VLDRVERLHGQVGVINTVDRLIHVMATSRMPQPRALRHAALRSTSSG